MKRSPTSLQRGAVLVEFLLGSAIFFVLIFSIIDISLLLTRRVLIFDALRSAANAAARQATDCEAVAQTTFFDEVNAQGLLRAEPIQFQARLTEQVMTDIWGYPLLNPPLWLEASERGLELQVSAVLRCSMLCSLLLEGFWIRQSDTAGLPYQDRIFVPLEDQAACGGEL